MILFACLLVFKVTNSAIEAKLTESQVFSIMSNTDGSRASTAYFEVVQICVSLGIIYAIKKIKYHRSYFLVMALIVISNCIIIFKFFGD